MNKKGLIFVFLFVASTVGAFTIVNAEQSNNKVGVTLSHIPSAYVPSGEIYVEIDSRFIENNQVFTEQDIISFAFLYDVCSLAWGGLVTTGNGRQADDWLHLAIPNNPATWNFTVEPVFWEYNTTRFAGNFNLMLDDYDLGFSNFDPAADDGTYQDIPLDLEIGWHYLTIVATELVSDGNHTEWHWEYAKDQKVFYVAENREDVPPLIEDAYNNVTLTATKVNSEDLGQYYTIDGYLSSPRPVAEVTGVGYQTIDAGTETAPLMSTAEVQYNASDTELGLQWTSWGTEYTNWTDMGPLTYVWWVNDGIGQNKGNGTWAGEIDPVTKLQIWREGETSLQLQKGQNFVFFSLFGFKVDDFAQYVASPEINGVVQLGHDMALIRIFVGEPVDDTGLGFGILISVSMLGLVVALGIVRRRK